MKQATSSSFNEGLLMDMNPLTTPQTCLSDALNATLVTFNGNEFTLQSDNGNIQIPGSQIKEGYVPVGMAEYGGIIYLALLNPETNDCEIGSIPSPDFDETPEGVGKDGIRILFKAIGGSSSQYSTFTKFFERDQLIINPGDKYEIVENGTKPKLYKYEYKALDFNEKEFELKTPNVVLSENNKKPFNQTISATLGLKITLDNIDYFDAYAFPQNDKLKIFYYGENKLQETGTEDDIYITEIKYKFVDSEGVEGLENTISISYENGLPTTKISDVIEVDFSTLGKVFSVIITPVSNYEKLDYLSKRLEINIEQLMTITPQSNLFKYFYNSTTKSLRFEFDATFLPSENDYMYVEFYDIWSDYSVIYAVEDPNPFGKNLLFIDVSNEELSEDFTNTIGGIPKEEIVTSTDQFQPTFGSKKIRNKQFLRPNNLYICAIHVIQNKDFSKPTTYKRAFVLNDYLNDNFSKDSIKDMTTLENKQPVVDANTSIVEYSQIPQIKIGVVDNLEMKTIKNGNTFYYRLEGNKDWSDDYNPQYYTEKYKVGKELSISTDIKSTIGAYGLIKLTDQNTTVNFNPNFNLTMGDTDDTYEFTNSKNGKYTYSLTAGRKISADIEMISKQINYHDESKDVTVWDKIYKNPNAPYSDASIEYIRNPSGRGAPNTIKSWNNSKVYPGEKMNEQTFDTYIKQLTGTNYSGYIIKWDGRSTDNLGYYTWRRWDDYSNLADLYGNDQLTYFFALKCDAKANKYYVLVPYMNRASAIDLLQSVYVPTSVSKNNVYLNYYTNIVDNDKYETSLYGSVDIVITGNINALQYYKSGNNFVTANYKTILDSFGVPFTDNYVKISSGNYSYSKTESLPTLTVNAGVDYKIKTLLVNSLSDLEREEANNLVDSTLIQDLVYSKKDSWSKYTSNFVWDKVSQHFYYSVKNYSDNLTYFRYHEYWNHNEVDRNPNLRLVANKFLDSGNN